MASELGEYLQRSLEAQRRVWDSWADIVPARLRGDWPIRFEGSLNPLDLLAAQRAWLIDWSAIWSRHLEAMNASLCSAQRERLLAREALGVAIFDAGLACLDELARLEASQAPQPETQAQTSESAAPQA
ncbi:hypothetical protein [Plasticicumulans acidivorans]|uniref:Phasin protein n=1 Tax=Plasticicumulans acidivorans TaxID=886464 RepID=A0A317MZN8_9GAMM|nr:hypothetical protein [Plasticicumulans acidivorans]PWV61212.1 hypothetical protein C7443_106226 [Plasticicumulans acidivorans]